MNQKIICPKCNFEISVDDVLSHQLEEKIRQEVEEKQKQKDLAFEEKEKALAERAKKIELVQNDLITTVNKQVAAKLPEFEKKIKEETEKEKADEISSYKKMLDDKNKKISELSEGQIKLMEDKEKFEAEKRTFALKLKEKEEEITKQVKQDLFKETDEKHQFEIAELKKQIEDVRKANAELDQKLKQGSQQTQGEVLELELEDMLRQEFKLDEIIPVAKGVNGADVTQNIKDKFGQICGTIVWEAKRAKSWKRGWISKVKKDRNSQKANMAIIVSTVLPKGIKHFDVIDGVWVSDFSSVLGLTRALRRGILDVYSAKQAAVGKNEKMEMLYSYLSGVEFKQKIECIVDTFSEMKSTLDKEKLAYSKMWKTREEQINKVVDNTVGMYGSLGGLMGNALPKIDILELPEGEDKL